MIARWQLALAEFNITEEISRSDTCVNADVLSRLSEKLKAHADAGFEEYRECYPLPKVTRHRQAARQPPTLSQRHTRRERKTGRVAATKNARAQGDPG